jgi:hypothetical protein
MRALRVLAAVLLVLAAGAAGADGLRIYRDELRPDPALPGSLAFTVTVEKAGSYTARLLVQGEAGREFPILLTLQPEEQAAAVELRFSFTGQGCG